MTFYLSFYSKKHKIIFNRASVDLAYLKINFMCGVNPFNGRDIINIAGEYILKRIL